MRGKERGSLPHPSNVQKISSNCLEIIVFEKNLIILIIGENASFLRWNCMVLMRFVKWMAPFSASESPRIREKPLRSKSAASDGVPVRVRSPAPTKGTSLAASPFCCFRRPARTHRHYTFLQTKMAIGSGHRLFSLQYCNWMEIATSLRSSQ